MTRGHPTISPLGDAAVLVELGRDVDLDVNRRVRALAALVQRETAGLPGWGVPVPGAASLLVPVDPLEPGVAAAAARIGALVTGAFAGLADAEVRAGEAGSGRSGRPDRRAGALADAATPVLEVPTHYDGPDLDAVSEMSGLSVAAIVDAHAAATYTTLFLGFVPGFGYLGPLPAELAMPRRPVPRTYVPAGAVAIGGAQTAVYPIDSPGGWWLLGRTELRFWDPSREPPALLRPGRRVRFVPVTDR